MTDPFDLQRFLDAQTPIYARVVGELRRGQKQSHWMWFIFPQVAGLGNSAMAQRFAIASRGEAVAYLGHAVLGSRLKECTALVTARAAQSAKYSAAQTDLKFQSSMTLFSAVSRRIRNSPQQLRGSTTERQTKGCWIYWDQSGPNLALAGRSKAMPHPVS